MAKSSESPEQKQLEDEIAQLRSDISKIVETLGQMGESKLDRAKNSAEQLYADAREKGEEALDGAKRKVQNIENQLCQTVHERPVTSLGIAAGIGFLLALMTRR